MLHADGHRHRRTIRQGHSVWPDSRVHVGRHHAGQHELEFPLHLSLPHHGNASNQELLIAFGAQVEAELEFVHVPQRARGGIGTLSGGRCVGPLTLGLRPTGSPQAVLFAPFQGAIKRETLGDAL